MESRKLKTLTVIEKLELLSEIDKGEMKKGEIEKILKDSWMNVKQTTIKNCFIKAGFFNQVEPEVILDIPEDLDIWSHLNIETSYQNYLNIDENVQICGTRSDEEIVQEILNKKTKYDCSTDEEEDTEDIHQSSPSKIISVKTMNQYLNEIDTLIQGEEDLNDDLFFAIQNLKTYAMKLQIKRNQKQTKISDFFSKNN